MRSNWIKSAALVTFIIFTALFVTGCWDRQELNTLGICGVLGIEKKEDKVNLSFEIYKPPKLGEKGGVKEGSAKYIQSSGDSFIDAIKNLTMFFDKKIFFAHSKEIIFNEETAREGFVDLLDLWVRQHEPWPNTYILVSKDVKPSEIIGVKSGIEETTANYIESLEKQNDETGKTVQTTVFKFLESYFNSGNSVVGVITREEKAESAGSEETSKENLYKLKAEGSAVFNGKNMVGFLDGIETRGVNFATGKLRSAVIVSPGDNGGKNTVEVIKSRRSIGVNVNGDKIKFDLTINILGMLSQETGNIATNERPDVIQKIEQQNSEVVKDQVESVIEKAQNELKTDVFGFDQALHQKYPEEWKIVKSNWNDVFPDTEIIVTISTDIKQIGLIHTPAERKSIND